MKPLLEKGELETFAFSRACNRVCHKQPGEQTEEEITRSLGPPHCGQDVSDFEQATIHILNCRPMMRTRKNWHDKFPDFGFCYFRFFKSNEALPDFFAR